MDDPRWTEVARRSGIVLEKVRDGLYVVKDDEERPSNQHEAIGKADREPPREDDAKEEEDT